MRFCRQSTRREIRLTVNYHFCGGCNPLYDRNVIYLTLKKTLDLIAAEKKEPPETKASPLVVVIDGCHRQCLRLSGAHPEGLLVFQAMKNDFGDPAAAIKLLLEKAGAIEQPDPEFLEVSHQK
jgi:hypothetical protein